jgi:hypothetical protein
MKTFTVEMFCKEHNVPLRYFGPVVDSSVTDLFYVKEEGQFGIDFSEVDCTSMTNEDCKNDPDVWTVRIIEGTV